MSICFWGGGIGGVVGGKCKGAFGFCDELCVCVCVCAEQCAHHFKLKILTRGKYARVKMNFRFIDTVSFIHDMHGLISGLHAIVSYRICIHSVIR